MTRSSRPFWLGEDGRGWDHVRIHTDVVKDPRVGPYHFAVYAALVVHAELETGDARPSVETIAGYFEGSGTKGSPGGMGSRTARTCIRDLERWHYIAVEERPGLASFYRVLPPPTLAPGAGVELVTLASVADLPGTTFQTTLAPGADEQEPVNKNQEREQRARAFAEFWKAYPERNGRKIGKAKAEAIWAKLSPADLDVVFVAVKHLARACAKGETFAPDPFRWLQGRLFEDWAAPTKRSPGEAEPADMPRCPHKYPIAEGDDGWFSACTECDDVTLERVAAQWRRERAS